MVLAGFNLRPIAGLVDPEAWKERLAPPLALL
jgi:hypothetical protein